VVDSTRSRAGRQHRYTILYEYWYPYVLPDLQVHARSLSSWPGWAAVRVKHFLVLLVVSVFAPRFLQPTGALDQRQPGSLTALNSL